ncbi:MAG: hypothetical protein PF448_08595 [Bacteroidales bacterium]|jgi:type II secretory pathway pseudopilin PulG|nr:hypothetical protein [Bacteroidales bacterium]
MKKTITIIIQIALLAVIVLFAFLIVKGIQKPIEFDKKRDARFSQVVDRLEDIRTAQVEYKKQNGTYTPDFDTLVNFIQTKSMPVVRKEGFVPDTLTEKEAVELEIVTRDTIFIPYMDTLFKDIKYKFSNIRQIPVGTKAKFAMDTATVMTGSKVRVKVFEAKVSTWDILDGLDEQLIINYNANKYKLDEGEEPVLKVGSLKEATNNAGNWE